MTHGALPWRRLDERLTETLHEEVASERISELVTTRVPSRFPGQLLLSLAGETLEKHGSAAIEAAVAVELTWLHQYLHAIPATDGALQPPASRSPYGHDAVAAILDGDVLQAHAFARLSRATDESETAGHCYRLLSRASVDSYERLSASRAGPDATTFAPIVGVAARIGAVLGGADRSTGAAVEQHVRALAGALPVQTPAGPRDQGGADAVEAAADQLLETVSSASLDANGLERLIQQARSAGGSRSGSDAHFTDLSERHPSEARFPDGQ